MVIGEAMAVGVPVVATRTGGVHYLVEEGRTGFLADVGDVSTLAARASQLLLDESRRAEFGAAAPNRCQRAVSERRRRRACARGVPAGLARKQANVTDVAGRRRGKRGRPPLIFRGTMAAATIHTLRRAGERLLHTRGHSRWRQQAPALAAVLILSVLAAHSIAGMNDQGPEAAAVVLLLAGAAIMLSIGAEHLLLGWLFLAPLLQESAGKTRVGHLLALALLYGASADRCPEGTARLDRGRGESRSTSVPALFVGFVFASLVVTYEQRAKTGAVGTLRDFPGPSHWEQSFYVAAFWPAGLSVTQVCSVVLLVQFFRR